MPREIDARLERLLRDVYDEGLWEPTITEEEAGPESVPRSLVEKAINEAEALTGKLFAIRLLEAGDEVGWGFHELLAEAADHEREVRELLLGRGDPLQLPPELLARLLWRTELDPADWKDLLTQY